MARGEETTAFTSGANYEEGKLQQIVDLGHGKAAAGFVGQMSAISWMHKVHEYLICVQPKRLEAPQVAIDQHSAQLQDLNYFMDESNLLSVDEDYIEAGKLPPPETAILLSQACFHSLHDAFRFLDGDIFLQTLSNFPRNTLVLSLAQRRWLALANTIWAVGARWLETAKLTGFNETHLVYYARARALGLDHRIVLGHPDVETLQAIGLLSFYFFINRSISQAWNILGQAIRHMAALGLHLDIASGAVDELERQRRSRIFYSIYSLEILLSEVTGRPKSISLEDVTTSIDVLADPVESVATIDVADSGFPQTPTRQPWLDFLGADRYLPQAMTGGLNSWRADLRSIGKGVAPEYFAHRVRLCTISQRISSTLYTGIHRVSWSEVQIETDRFESEMRKWRETIPPGLDIRNANSTDHDPRPNIELAMYYHSVLMILYRQFLTDIDIKDQSDPSARFIHYAARSSFFAAMDLLGLLPDNPVGHEAYRFLPWWSLIHYLCQAAAILTLELCLDMRHFDEADGSMVMRHLGKAALYLRCLAESSLSAYKAWRIFQQFVGHINAKYDADNVQHPPELTPPPHGWTEADELRLVRAFMYKMKST
ncbi:hypothetical protein LTR92_011046 [Exophiala xenobiotica]|nr:hypothetical protein LTR92_011046 [Exophiala xenobiotica]